MKFSKKQVIQAVIIVIGILFIAWTQIDFEDDYVQASEPAAKKINPKNSIKLSKKNFRVSSSLSILVPMRGLEPLIPDYKTGPLPVKDTLAFIVLLF